MSAILWSASAFLVFSLIFTENEFSKLLSVIDFMPLWFSTLCGTVHATIQSIYKFWLPGLAPIGWSRLLETSAEAMQTFTEFLKFGGPDPNSITGGEKVTTKFPNIFLSTLLLVLPTDEL